MTTTHSFPKNPSNPSITVPLTPPQPEVPAETPDISNLSLADDVDRDDDTFGSGSSDQSTLSNIDERALNRALQLFRDGEIEEEEYQKIVNYHEEYRRESDNLDYGDSSDSQDATNDSQDPPSTAPSSPRKNSLVNFFSLFPTRTDRSDSGVREEGLDDPRAVRAVRAASRAKERKSRMKQKVDAQRQAQIQADIQTWSETLKTWSNKSLSSPAVAQLCARGIPPKVRGDAWSKMIGNPLNITRDLWMIHEKRGSQMMEAARRRSTSGADHDQEEDTFISSPPPASSPTSSPASPPPPPPPSRSSHSRDHTVIDIDVDIPRTFPYLSFFHDGGEWEGRLRRLLATYCSYRPDIGYIQGMSFLAAMLLLSMDSYEAFLSLANLVNSPRYFSPSYSPMLSSSQVSLFNDSFKANLPLLHSHFKRHDVTHELFLIDWRLSVFCRILPLDTAVRIWDLFLREGETFFVKCSLGILKLLRSTESLSDTDTVLENISKIRVQGSPSDEGGSFCTPS
ncbi:hypothetical protein TrCOL_g6166 [Triparma columacea]|uniref:Rab-GAP TBC domain-containing protein n=1 Tax=Triparma columacea TaxID=722753 RepID=A0A9W7G434_9STRA|nr:hypothetical protein TrCOL_g6166 [Triparma columacea]